MPISSVLKILNNVKLQTAQVTTSGTFIDFSIPSGVKKITIMFNGVSTNGTSLMLIQLSSGGTVSTSGYLSGAGSRTAEIGTTQGIVLAPVNPAASSFNGNVFLNVLDSAAFKWVSSGIHTRDDGFAASNGGNKTLTGVLDKIRLTTVNGTDVFDAGSINISWEF